MCLHRDVCVQACTCVCTCLCHTHTHGVIYDFITYLHRVLIIVPLDKHGHEGFVAGQVAKVTCRGREEESDLCRDTALLHSRRTGPPHWGRASGRVLSLPAELPVVR